MKKEVFGKILDRDIYLLSLENKNRMKVTLSNYGALIIKLEVPDSNGIIEDVALGYDSLEEYQVNDNFYGAIVGPNANRVANASYILDGVRYQLDANDGKNNLHSHRTEGLHKRIWDYREIENGVEFSIELKDGEMGFGGNKNIAVKYALSDDNELSIIYDVFDRFDFNSNSENEQIDIESNVLYTKKSDNFQAIMHEVNQMLFDKRRPFLKSHVSEVIESLEISSAFPNFDEKDPLLNFRKSQVEEVVSCLYIAQPTLSRDELMQNYKTADEVIEQQKENSAKMPGEMKPER